MKCSRHDFLYKNSIISDKSLLNNKLRLIAWEATKSCNLSCIHCRASSTSKSYSNELSTNDALKLMDDIVQVGDPIVIVTGGEPLLRKDIFDVIQYGTSIGLRVVMAPNGTLITDDIARKMLNSGVKRISISIDGADSESHDKFRGVNGAFDGAINGIKCLKRVGVEFQINISVTSDNFDQVPKVFALAEEIGAVAFHIFLLVPTGRGKYIVNRMIDMNKYEEILNWVYDQRGKTSLQLKTTCAPHYYRVLRQRAKQEGNVVSFDTYGFDAVTRGCLAGIGFCFISNSGNVQPCGYTNICCGNIVEEQFSKIWNESSVFKRLRDFSQLGGKCNKCDYVNFCGGCRARAYEATGDYMAEEPFCLF